MNSMILTTDRAITDKERKEIRLVDLDTIKDNDKCITLKDGLMLNIYRLMSATYEKK